MVKKNLPANAEDTGLNPWVGKIPGRRKWQPTPLFLPIEVHEQRCLVGYSPLGCKELDTAERPRMHACLKKSQIKNSKYSSTGGEFLSQSKIFTFIFKKMTFIPNLHVCTFLFLILKRAPKLCGTGP